MFKSCGKLSQAMMIRKPAAEDYVQISHLLEDAFSPSPVEMNLVKKLRDKGKISFDFIIEENREVVAYICYSAAYDTGKVRIGYHLAPVAVLPKEQGKGLGRRIIIESLKTLGNRYPVYVLGDPNYYSQFGFRIDQTQKCIFDPSGEHFMVLADNLLPLPPREVSYEEEFLD
jgi:putative acetyltransferase